MHYYKHNISDYTAHTCHLSPIEDIVYRRLFELYLLREKPLDRDVKVLARHIRMSGHHETVKAILEEFFVLCEEGWAQPHAQGILEKYHANTKSNIENGKRGGRPKKKMDSGKLPDETERVSGSNPCKTDSVFDQKATTNQESKTTNQESKTTNQNLPAITQLPTPQDTAPKLIPTFEDVAKYFFGARS